MDNEDEVSLKLTLDDAQAKSQLAALSRSIGRSAYKARLDVVADPKAAQASVDRLRADIARSEAVIQLRANAGAPRREIADLQTKLAALRAQAGTINVQANTQQATREIDQLRRSVIALNREAGQVRVGGVFGAGRIGGTFANGALLGAGSAYAANALGGGRFTTAGSGLGGMGGGIAGGVLGGPAGLMVGGAVGSTAGAVAGVGLDMTASVIAGGINSLATLQQYETVLKSVIPDQREANRLFEELKQTRIDLPTVQMSTMADAMVKLAGAGRDSKGLGEDVKAMMDAAAVSSVGIGEGTIRIARAVAQMRTNGRLLGEELNQIAEVGIPASQILIKAFGTGIDEIKAASQEGKIEIDSIIDALLEGMREKYDGALEAQSETLKGRLAELANKFTMLQEKVAEPLLEPIIDALDRLSKAADSGALDGIATAMKAVTDASVGFLNFLDAFFQRVGKQANLNDLTVTTDAGLKSGDLTPEQARQASAVQLAAKSLANARRNDQTAILSKDQVAAFLNTQSGATADSKNFVTPDKVTDAQQSAVTDRIDRLANENARLRYKSGNFDLPFVGSGNRSEALVDMLGRSEKQGLLSGLGAVAAYPSLIHPQALMNNAEPSPA